MVMASVHKLSGGTGLCPLPEGVALTSEGAGAPPPRPLQPTFARFSTVSAGASAAVTVPSLQPPLGRAVTTPNGGSRGKGVWWKGAVESTPAFGRGLRSPLPGVRGGAAGAGRAGAVFRRAAGAAAAAPSPEVLRVRAVFEQNFKDGNIKPDQMLRIIACIQPSFTEAEHEAAAREVQVRWGTNSDGVPCAQFLDWIFSSPAPRAKAWSPGLDDLYHDRSKLEDAIVCASFKRQLVQLLKDHPYLEPGSSVWPHPLQYWVKHCRESFEANHFSQAQADLRRVLAGLEAGRRQIAEAFRRFDADVSGFIDAAEYQHMCAYLGWGSEAGDPSIEVDADGRISLKVFEEFIGRMGGIQQIFEHRRLRISASRRDVDDYAGLAVGSRVRAHFYVRGHKSRSWREAQVLAVNVERAPQSGMGPASYGMLLEFGFGTRFRARQVVPATWVLSGVEDASVISALREIGVLDDQQAFWALLLPDTEMQAVQRLEECQRKALTNVRTTATQLHEEALPKVRTRFNHLGYTGRELEAVLTWIQDFAPVVVHVNLDKMGQFMESDDFYRNQFETKTSGGAGGGDQSNSTRKGWEANLFGGAYDDSKPFDRCKYGALNVMNDWRGVVSARQYGDSYMVLKDVRLRLTFASTDSGGIHGRRLAVLDKYAHVLAEYNDQEIKGLVDVAMAATGPTTGVAAAAELLRGSTEDPTADWVTLGIPGRAEQSGRFFFEVVLQKGCQAPQVGLLSTLFERMPRSKSTQGVGDDKHGWAVDGQNASLWHDGCNSAWPQVWPSEGTGATRQLQSEVVVGVAVDFDLPAIWFSTDGVWVEEAAFDSSSLPREAALYPAVSLKGKAAFNFGPGFRHKPPSKGGPFARWSGGLTGCISVDVPYLGNEGILALYKEVQIHGEVNLGKHVQRLVACSKYREASKIQRTYALRITKGGAPYVGTYQRVGAHNGKPIYRSADGPAVFFDASMGFWCLGADGEDFAKRMFWAPAAARSGEPPRQGWKTFDQNYGVIPLPAFKMALANIKSVAQCTLGHAVKKDARPSNYCDLCGTVGTAYHCSKTCDYDLCAACGEKAVNECKTGIDEETTDKLVAALAGEVDEGGGPMVFRVRGSNSLAAEWAKLDFTCSDDIVWQAGVEEARRQLKEEYGLDKAHIFETSHPYLAKTFTLKTEVHMEDSDALVARFSRRSCTHDDRARLRISQGGLRRDAAGPGARVQVPVPGGDKVWGTVVARGEGMWRVSLDRTPSRLEKGIPKEERWPTVGADVEARYKNGSWYKAKIEEIRDGAVYVVAWYDGDPSDQEHPLSDIRKVSKQVQDAHRRIDDSTRYAQVPLDQHGECFAILMDEPRQLRVAYAGAGMEADEQGYEAKVGDEIAGFSLDRACPLSPISVSEFVHEGPAQDMGVRVGWYLDIVATVAGPSRKQITDLLRGIGGTDFGHDPQPSVVVDAIFHYISEAHARLDRGLRSLSNATLFFINSSAVDQQLQLLPEAIVRFDQGTSLGDEVKDFIFREKATSVSVEGFSKRGRLHAAGVRGDWVLDMRRTLHLNPRLGQPLTLASQRSTCELAVGSPEKTEGSVPAVGSKELDRGKPVMIIGDDEDAGSKGIVVDFDEDGDPIVLCEGKSSPAAYYRHDVILSDAFELEASPTTATPELAPVASPIVPEVHKFLLERGDTEESKLEVFIMEKLTGLMSDLGILDPMEMASMFPDFEPDVTVRAADGSEIESPDEMATLGDSSFPVTIEFTLPKPAAKIAAEAAAAVGAKDADMAPAAEEKDDAAAKAEAEADKAAVEAAAVEKAALKAEAKRLAEEELLRRARTLLANKSGLTFVFKQPHPTPSQVFMASGPVDSGAWETCIIPGDFAALEFSTDGDSSSDPSKRWGALVVVAPKCAFAQEGVDLDAFCDRWVSINQAAEGVGNEGPVEVERAEWDETRLRALCARHGWEFEWMTEDGERRRRLQERFCRVQLPPSAAGAVCRPKADESARPDGVIEEVAISD